MPFLGFPPKLPPTGISPRAQNFRQTPFSLGFPPGPKPPPVPAPRPPKILFLGPSFLAVSPPPRGFCPRPFFIPPVGENPLFPPPGFPFPSPPGPIFPHKHYHFFPPPPGPPPGSSPPPGRPHHRSGPPKPRPGGPAPRRVPPQRGYFWAAAETTTARPPPPGVPSPSIGTHRMGIALYPGPPFAARPGVPPRPGFGPPKTLWETPPPPLPAPPKWGPPPRSPFFHRGLKTPRGPPSSPRLVPLGVWVWDPPV